MLCSCKGQCAKKKGKGACKCREANKTCHDLCTCDKRKCKNKVSEVVVPRSLLNSCSKLKTVFFSISGNTSREYQ